jgi:hypothetical protein
MRRLFVILVPTIDGSGGAAGLEVNARAVPINGRAVNVGAHEDTSNSGPRRERSGRLAPAP